ncbi:tetratricopeptide repeat protein [Tateyamaria sp. syn59]|uniref:tetratricopeptide repeat protein n=1 Tax=Tateyamaria sp. syn59 TaxID=2576942 RepID=UPI001CB8B85B|nr:tetratricopeptide repeat protein [Tateyamaria sp. syn59]
MRLNSFIVPSVALFTVLVSPAFAQTMGQCGKHKSDAYGTHNPEELTLCGHIDRMRQGETHPVLGFIGYVESKAGNHDTAREIFSTLADAGNIPAMTWMAWMEDNGLGGPEDAAAAAEWDRRSMEAGSSVGAFNYGLDILRGRGVTYDEELGRRIIQRAAELGDSSAQHLIDNDFDLDSVTPDADEWKYEKKLF